MLDTYMLNPDMRAYVIRAEPGDKARDTGIRRWGSLILTADHTLTHLHVHMYIHIPGDGNGVVHVGSILH